MKLNNKISQIIKTNLDDYSVLLKYNDDEIYIAKLASIFSSNSPYVEEILVGSMFAMCFIENGALAWPNGFELCPDFLRINGTKITSEKVA